MGKMRMRMKMRMRKMKGDKGCREVMDMTCRHTINPSSWHLRSISPGMVIKGHNTTVMGICIFESNSFQSFEFCRRLQMVARNHRG